MIRQSRTPGSGSDRFHAGTQQEAWLLRENHAVAKRWAEVNLLRAGRKQSLLVSDIWTGGQAGARAGGVRLAAVSGPKGETRRWRLGAVPRGAREQLEARGGGGRRRDAVGLRGGTPVLNTLADLPAVAVVGRQGQVGVEVALPEVQRPVGQLQHLG